MGKSTPKLNGREIVTGQHKYTSDMKLPGMVYGRVLRPETFGARIGVALDSTAAEGDARRDRGPRRRFRGRDRADAQLRRPRL